MIASTRKAPRRWTPEEDLLLYEEAMKQSSSSVKDWNRIAAKLPGRTNKDCRKRWVNKVSGGLKKGPWSKDEDDRLRKAVKNFGQRWQVVAEAVRDRSADQCAKRWQLNLDPKLERRPWTKEEDDRLLQCVEKMGHVWKDIGDNHFARRSRNDIKNRYTILCRRNDEAHRGSFSPQEMPEEEEEDSCPESDEDNISESESNNFNVDYTMDLDQESFALDGLGDYIAAPACSENFLSGPSLLSKSPPGMNLMGYSQDLENTHFPNLLCELDGINTPSVLDSVSDRNRSVHDEIFDISMSQQMDGGHFQDPDCNISDRKFLSMSPIVENMANNDVVQFQNPSIVAESSVRQVTLTIEHCERGLINKLLEVVGATHSKSKIEIIP